ncbi:MAG TPA: SDR family NAD(P)-dependent oxidoreductase [Pyrinomonadaceae bacterium]|nr:SDR family NAD(P)-dependent oxidoreductase [Pyrinomonadaceae bacterium]
MAVDYGLNIKGRVAVISGGSRGIGRAVVQKFAEAGAHVSVNFLKDEEAALAVVEEARGLGVKAIALRADVSRPDDAEKLIQASLENFGRIDFLVCNAGVWQGAPVEEMTEALWDRVLEINLKGTWTLCRAAVAHMKRAGFGRIVIISSTAGQRGEAGYSNYAASKGGQIAFTKSLAAELGRYGITVNAVAPGWVDTEMSAVALGSEESRKEIFGEIPLGRVATVEDIALPVLFLCSDWARHITGEVLSVNGGSVL